MLAGAVAGVVASAIGMIVTAAPAGTAEPTFCTTEVTLPLPSVAMLATYFEVEPASQPQLLTPGELEVETERGVW